MGLFLFFNFFPFKTVLSFPVLQKGCFVVAVVSGDDVNISSKRQLPCAILHIMI